MYTRIALRALEVDYSDIGEVAVNCEKTQLFLITLYLRPHSFCPSVGPLHLRIYRFYERGQNHCILFHRFTNKTTILLVNLWLTLIN